MELADFKEFKEQLKLQGIFINREPEHKGESILLSIKRNGWCGEENETIIWVVRLTLSIKKEFLATGARNGGAGQTQSLQEPGWHRLAVIYIERKNNFGSIQITQGYVHTY